MPNWCSGVIKIRGKRDNIKAYLKDLFKPLSLWGGELQVNVQENDFYIKFCVKDQYKDLDGLDEVIKMYDKGPTFDRWYLKSTSRAFIDQGKEISFDFWCDEQEDEILTIEGFKQAWSIVPEEYTQLSDKHQVDLHIFGYEKGMEYTQEVEIIKGKITKNKETEYDGRASAFVFLLALG
ncbi:TPA: hypothetical protein TVN91_000466 [Streptococcus equi subsp. zooepidemicus]|nr:hypothetical protein [Streptococcus equi subsp. zooepidemicus]